MARPRKQVDVLEVLRLRLQGMSWPEIAARMRLGVGTVYRAYRQAIALLQPFQNPKARHSGKRPPEQNQPETVLGSEKVYPNGQAGAAERSYNVPRFLRYRRALNQ